MKDYKEIFEQRKNDSRYNTSYPLSPSHWAQFRTQGQLAFPERDISFYIHIPFCEQLCTFCEYTRTICPNEQKQAEYLRAVDHDVADYVSAHCADHLLRGFDIGGGTPTALSDRNFWNLMQIFSEAIEWMDLADDFEPSIEGTFQTLNEAKLRMMVETGGIRRLSLGMQSSDDRVLKCGGRRGLSLTDCLEKRKLIADCGIRKLNIDLMYGLKGQTVENCRRDLEWIEALKPEQVTLYEFRPNMSRGGADLSKGELFELYSVLYEGIKHMGYHGDFGSNAFSMDPDDRGLSSYLRSRMYEGIAYKGFGLSAQSMSTEGVSYNLGKGRPNLGDIICSDSLPEEFTYILPREEILSKYISIAAYGGEVSMKAASRLLGRDFLELRADIIDWLVSEGLLQRWNDILKITREGFVHYGAVFSLLRGENF